MTVALGNLYYFPLKLYVLLGSYLYFRKLRVVGRRNIPSRGPVIFAINHQNALLDALLISVISLRNPHFLTRADVFNNKFVDKFLRGLKMLPIYRIRDGYDSIKKNEATFDAATKILNNGGVVGIFPEGSHSLKYKVRPLKKGAARIAFMAEEEGSFALGTKILPIGIQYESHFLPEGRTLISFGEPISVSEYNEIYQKDKNVGIDTLTKDLHIQIKKLVVHIDNDYDIVHEEYQRRRAYRTNLVEQLRADQKLVHAIESGEPFDEISNYGNLFALWSGRLWRFLWKILAFVPRKVVNRIVSRTVKDPHFNATMRFGYSIFLYPIFFLIIYFIVRSLVS